MRYCFYSGYRDMKGGYTTLLLTLIKELYYQKQEVVLLNYTQGLFSEELLKEDIQIKIIDLDTVNWNNISAVFFPTDIFVITRFIDPYRHLFRINPRVIYFDINDFICSISDYKYGLKFPSLGKTLVNKLLEKQSLVFMDDTGVFNLKNCFNLDIPNPVFLPIPVTVTPVNRYLERPSVPGRLRLTYIGRSVNWKMTPLSKIFSDISRAGYPHPLDFHVVVDDIAEYKKLATPEVWESENLRIKVSENIPPSGINLFLLDNSDLHFAMGTAALDAARLGIPTIVMDYSTRLFPAGYRYKWLFETTAFSLGRNLDKLTVEGGQEMTSLLQQLTTSGKSRQISQMCFDYVQDNHGAAQVVDRLQQLCKSASFRFRDARHLVPFYFKPHTFIKKAAMLFSGRNKA